MLRRRRFLQVAAGGLVLGGVGVGADVFVVVVDAAFAAVQVEAAGVAETKTACRIFVSNSSNLSGRLSRADGKRKP